jgi:hypothetical protein
LLAYRQLDAVLGLTDLVGVTLADCRRGLRVGLAGSRRCGQPACTEILSTSFLANSLIRKD